MAGAFSWERTVDRLLSRFTALVDGAVPAGPAAQLGVQASARLE
jgi:hypothetical protein